VRRTPEQKGRVLSVLGFLVYLVHSQAEKGLLISKGYGSQEGSRTMTIHEAQGQTYESMVTMLASFPHAAVVTVSRRTNSYIYYTDCPIDDVITHMISRVETVTTAKIWDYNLQMSIRRGDKAVRNQLIGHKI
jgi:hypothetical protein